ncbi:hypothetical protein B0T20DRAFT_393260 [Sordaria brevicollis]|uniref:Uncharacterized protein n=1 Tax=Sordaria brevicollis TaxID=83679 RepID=A0AAE0PFA1_SORBR|nr:hypothetical protein B0T20DRAFT_393260 [Sordaria brevicollis]
MPFSHVSATEDDGTSPTSHTVNSGPAYTTTETAARSAHEAGSTTPPFSDVNTEAHAILQTTSESVACASVASGASSDIEELSATESWISFTSTEIMTRLRHRTVDRIMQHVCHFLDVTLKNETHQKPAESGRRTGRLDCYSAPRPCLPKTIEEMSRPHLINDLESFPVQPGPSWYNSAACQDIPTDWMDLDKPGDPAVPIIPYSFLAQDLSTNLSLDSGVCMSESGAPGEQSGYDLSTESHPDIIAYSKSKPEPWTAFKGSVFPTHFLRTFSIDGVSGPRYPQELDLDELDTTTIHDGIFHDPKFTPTSDLTLSVNTMMNEVGSSVHNSGIRDRGQKRSADDDGDGDGRRKRCKGQENTVRRFACPFFKRNPRKYGKWTSCPGPGWDEIHRVKLLTAHLQRDPPCDMRQNLSLVEGVTTEHKEKLLSRKKTHGDLTDEEKWRHMYMILFPDDDEASIPSPYYEESDCSELEDYARFLRREMPSIVRRELESLPDEEFQYKERLLPRLDTASFVQEQQPQSTEAGSSRLDPRASGSGSGTTLSASDSVNTLTPPPAPELVFNAEEFADSLMGLDVEGVSGMDSEELRKLLNEWGPSDDTVHNAGLP